MSLSVRSTDLDDDPGHATLLPPFDLQRELVETKLLVSPKAPPRSATSMWWDVRCSSSDLHHILTMLDLGGIPMRSEHRGDADPSDRRRLGG